MCFLKALCASTAPAINFLHESQKRICVKSRGSLTKKLMKVFLGFRVTAQISPSSSTSRTPDDGLCSSIGSNTRCCPEHVGLFPSNRNNKQCVTHSIVTPETKQPNPGPGRGWESKHSAEMNFFFLQLSQKLEGQLFTVEGCQVILGVTFEVFLCQLHPCVRQNCYDLRKHWPVLTNSPQTQT